MEKIEGTIIKLTGDEVIISKRDFDKILQDLEQLKQRIILLSEKEKIGETSQNTIADKPTKKQKKILNALNADFTREYNLIDILAALGEKGDGSGIYQQLLRMCKSGWVEKNRLNKENFYKISEKGQELLTKNNQ